MRTFAVLADALTAGAIVAGGVAVYFTLTSGKKSSTETKVGLGPGNLQLKGTF
jgi:hypothetical protein